jgi:CHASE3 domain sensor protein
VTLKQLAELVADMRAKQRGYFRTRSSAALEESKSAERAVDRAVAEVLRQPSLFGE